MRGPRLIFKTDAESSIGRGCVTYGGHFRPEMARVLHVACMTADPLWSEITATEGWRPKLRASRDLHPEGRAWDLGLNHIDGDEELRRREGEIWAGRMRKELGPDYQVIVHGEGRNLHVHVELDP